MMAGDCKSLACAAVCEASFAAWLQEGSNLALRSACHCAAAAAALAALRSAISFSCFSFHLLGCKCRGGRQQRHGHAERAAAAAKQHPAWHFICTTTHLVDHIEAVVLVSGIPCRAPCRPGSQCTSLFCAPHKCVCPPPPPPSSYTYPPSHPQLPLSPPAAWGLLRWAGPPCLRRLATAPCSLWGAQERSTGEARSCWLPSAGVGQASTAATATTTTFAATCEAQHSTPLTWRHLAQQADR